mmetsp:Transcript_34266/g.79051  ORF Transcript_34266/g.79051 Transcript_34266/m.79051 type:complete len:84 (-) Transcript_34266:951-1202(-)
MQQDTTRVFYACDVKIPSSIPSPVVDFLGRSALTQATSWVKKESESEPQAEVPSEFAPRPVRAIPKKRRFGFMIRRDKSRPCR